VKESYWPTKMLQKHARCRLAREKDRWKHQRECTQKKDSCGHYSTQKTTVFRPYLSHARWLMMGKESVAGLSWWSIVERKTSKKMDTQHHCVYQIDPVWSKIKRHGGRLYFSSTVANQGTRRRRSSTCNCCISHDI